VALREKLVSCAQPFLESGEQITQIFHGQVGPTPWLIPIFLNKVRIIAVTDRAVLVLDSANLTARSTALLQRLPRQTRLGPIDGKIWGKILIGGERIWVHKRFSKDVQAADAPLG